MSKKLYPITIINAKQENEVRECKPKLSADIAEQTEAFLKSGGKVQHIESHHSEYIIKSLREHNNATGKEWKRKQMEEMKLAKGKKK